MSTKPKINPWGPYKTFQVKPRVTYEMYTGPIASSSINVCRVLLFGVAAQLFPYANASISILAT